MLSFFHYGREEICPQLCQNKQPTRSTLFVIRLQVRNSTISETVGPYNWKCTTELKQFWNCHNWPAALPWLLCPGQGGKVPSWGRYLCTRSPWKQHGHLLPAHGSENGEVPKKAEMVRMARKIFPYNPEQECPRKLEHKGFFPKIVQFEIYLS